MEYELVYGLPKAEVLAQMAEELTEAAQAALKLRRYGWGKPHAYFR